jgi:hypothetical protein
MYIRGFNRSLVRLLALFMGMGIPLISFAQEIDKEILVKRLIAAHNRYEGALKSISGTSHMQTNSGHSCSQRFDILGPLVRNINGPLHCTEDQCAAVESLNDDYFFSLSRPKDVTAWKLVGVDRELPKSAEKRDHWRLILSPPLLLSQTVHNIPLRKIFKEESFRLASATPKGKHLVVEFSAMGLVGRKSVKKLFGAVTLSNDEHMLVQSATTTVELEIAKKPKVIEETLFVTYDDSRGMPLVVKSVSTAEIKKGEGLGRFDTQFDVTYLAKEPALSDFFLSAFGLDEPDGPKSSPKIVK